MGKEGVPTRIDPMFKKLCEERSKNLRISQRQASRDIAMICKVKLPYITKVEIPHETKKKFKTLFPF